MNRTYRVVYINPTIARNEGGDRVASQLEILIQQNVNDGWEFVSVESLSTWVAGTNGCFGINAQPGYTNNLQMVVFSQKGV